MGKKVCTPDRIHRVTRKALSVPEWAQAISMRMVVLAAGIALWYTSQERSETSLQLSCQGGQDTNLIRRSSDHSAVGTIHSIA
ncbi:MAG: hypothetical protein D6736_05670 [Nitrospinota bacterium]|nr:MAG: hypothetical protein D6736_05670 [Nitrospinota bacterium]